MSKIIIDFFHTNSSTFRRLARLEDLASRASGRRCQWMERVVGDAWIGIMASQRQSLRHGALSYVIDEDHGGHLCIYIHTFTTRQWTSASLSHNENMSWRPNMAICVLVNRSLDKEMLPVGTYINTLYAFTILQTLAFSLFLSHSSGLPYPWLYNLHLTTFYTWGMYGCVNSKYVPT